MTVQRIGNDSIYGTGSDGTVIINSNTSISRDMYYNSLTINANVVLNTNGFRVFVKNNLVLNGTIGVGSSDSANTGTLSGRTPKATSTSFSIGGSAAGTTYQASQLQSGVVYLLENAAAGFYIDTNGVVRTFTGGAGGEDGVSGTVTPAGSGQPGGSGDLNRNVGVPGGTGYAGSPGTNVPAASAGIGAQGGPVVIVVAKNISGTGSIISQGANAVAGGPSATGTAGSPGNNGNRTPSASLPYHTDGSTTYRTGDGVHGPHAHTTTPNLPHGSHVPHSATNLHSHQYVYVLPYPTNTFGAHVGGAHGHTHTPHNTGHENTASYHLIHGIPHNHSHRNHSGIAFSHYYSVSPETNRHHDSPTSAHHFDHGYGPEVVHDHYPRLVVYHHHAYGVARSPGTVSHSGVATKLGGLPGAGGTAGSTTAGTDGKSGGGGGIIIITDNIAAEIVKSASGGSVNGVSASNGNVFTIINT